MAWVTQPGKNAANGFPGFKSDLVNFLVEEQRRLSEGRPDLLNGSPQKKYDLLQRTIGALSQFEGTIRSGDDIDGIAGVSGDTKKKLKRQLDDLFNPGFLPAKSSGGHAILVAMLKARKVRLS